jgi:hypothetical protein
MLTSVGTLVLGDLSESAASLMSAADRLRFAPSAMSLALLVLLHASAGTQALEIMAASGALLEV